MTRLRLCSCTNANESDGPIGPVHVMLFTCATKVAGGPPAGASRLSVLVVEVGTKVTGLGVGTAVARGEPVRVAEAVEGPGLPHALESTTRTPHMANAADLMALPTSQLEIGYEIGPVRIESRG